MKHLKIYFLLMILLAIGTMIFFYGCRENKASIIKIGAILPLSGPGSDFGNYIKDGLELAKEEINQKQGIKYEIIYEDSKNQPKIGILSFNKLNSVEKPLLSIIALSSVAKAVSELSNSVDAIQIYIAVALPNITDGKNRFRVYPESVGMAGKMAKYAVKNIQFLSAAIIYINDDFGKISCSTFSKILKENNKTIISEESYELTQMDYRNQLTKLKVLNPDLIYISGYGAAYANIIKQIREMKIKAILTADMTCGLPTTRAILGKTAENIIFVDGKIQKDFSEIFFKRYKREATSYAGYAYDIIKISNFIVNQKNDINKKIMRQELLKIKNYKGAMGNISINKNGDSNLEFSIKKIHNGKIIELE